MREQINKYNLLVYVGFIWSAVAAMYVVGQYFTILENEIAIQALEPRQDIVIDKLSKLPSDDKSASLILSELHAQNKQLKMIYDSLVRVNSASKNRAKFELYFWIGIVVIFACVAIIGRRGTKINE